MSRETLSSFHVALSRFAERFGYSRWLYHLIHGVAPAHSEIGRAVSRTGPAVYGWMDMDEPPNDYRVHAPLAEFLGVSEEWLIKNQGEPPRPDLWKAWIAERRRAERMPASAFREPGKKPVAKKRPA